MPFTIEGLDSKWVPNEEDWDREAERLYKWLNSRGSGPGGFVSWDVAMRIAALCTLAEKKALYPYD